VVEPVVGRTDSTDVRREGGPDIPPELEVGGQVESNGAVEPDAIDAGVGLEYRGLRVGHGCNRQRHENEKKRFPHR
jgi:hypothetical protein